MYRVSYEFDPRLRDSQLQYAVIPARYQDRWIFVRQAAKNTFELPAGRREKGETILETARRELWEETGAVDFSLEQVCAFAVTAAGSLPGPCTAYGMLYLARIKKRQALPAGTEIGENILLEKLPGCLSYPEIQPGLFRLADSVLHYAIRPASARDAPAIWRLNRLGMGYEYDLAGTGRQLGRILQDKASRILVAVEKSTGRVDGYIHLADYQASYSARLKNILALAVDPAVQKRSLGRRLLAAGEDWAFKAGAAGIRLVSGQQRAGAHLFYEACGYSFSKEQKNFRKMF